MKSPLHHHELLHMIDGYNSSSGQIVAGHRGYFLKGVGVMLNQALINYGLAFLRKRNYQALQPPFFMNKEIMAETAQVRYHFWCVCDVCGLWSVVCVMCVVCGLWFVWCVWSVVCGVWCVACGVWRVVCVVCVVCSLCTFVLFCVAHLL